MTETKTINRQPSGTGLDYADPTKFKFQTTKLPRVEFNCIQANIPGITLTEIQQPTRLIPIKIPGNDLTFENLNITFIVDEDLTNYRSVHDWMAGLSQMDSDEKYRALISDGQDRMPRSQQNNSTDAGRVTSATNDGAIYSDSKLIILSARNTPLVELTFTDCYPLSLSALEYNQNATDVEYLQATVSFGYKIHSYTTPF
jgi:hypothetical protein|tara:strand:- start:1360 stop:1959 length:600 start_codon:yes stop_codon:yes gene_type:complete